MKRFLRLFAGFASLATVLAAAGSSAAEDISNGPAISEQRVAITQQVAQAQKPPSLQRRRNSARQGEIRRAAAQCRTIAQQYTALKSKPCARGDRLDARTNICRTVKNIWKPYVRWDPAAGRCKPRDIFDGFSCIGTKQRYQPGKRLAHSAAHSQKMYGQATAHLKKKVSECRRIANSMKYGAAAERSKNARFCGQARKLKRADLVKLYCN